MPTSRRSAPAAEDGRHRSAFESTAKRREAKARAAEDDGNLITARDNWYMAAIHYGRRRMALR